jgi:zinc protease
MNLRRFLTIGASALALAAVFAPPAAAEDPIPAGAAAKQDPALKRGTLPNGLRYAIMPNRTPAGAVSIRLALNVGSYEEADEERGFAHFLEHLAFRSTRKFPDGALDNRFASLGVALGRDQNATTTLNETIYRVDLPTPNAEGIRSVMEWMRSAGDGIIFDPAGIDVERGVVLAEKEARNSPVAEMQRQVTEFQGRGLRSASREVIGTDETLRGATPAGLKAFYERWYRPENAVLVVTGDIDVAKMEKLTEEIFGSWRGAGAAPERPKPGSPPARGVEAFTRSTSAMPTAASACRVSAPDADRSASLQRMRREMHSALWVHIVNKRLLRLSNSGGALLGANMLVNRDGPDARFACLVAVPTMDKWKEGLADAQAELRRFAAAGPTEQEVTTGIEELGSSIGGQVYQSATRHTVALAESIADSELSGRTFQHPTESLRTFEIVMAGVKPADVLRAFNADWTGSGPLLVSFAPQAPSPRDLASAWAANERARPLEAYADRGKASWPYTDFGKAGKVAKREVIADPGFVRLHYKNGTILNFKQTSYQSGGVEIRIRFGHGERTLTPELRVPASLAAGLFPMGGLGRMGFEDVQAVLAQTTWGFDLALDVTAYSLSSRTLTEQLPQQMQVLAAYLTDPAFGPLIDQKLPTSIDTVYRMYRSDPNAVAVEALEKALYPDRLSIPPREQLDRFRAKDFDRLLRPALDNSPFEITIVGDVPEQQAADAVARTFGALRRRPPLGEPKGDGPFRRFPAKLPPPAQGVHEGPAEKAAAVLVWPTYVAVPERRPEEYAIGLATQVFEARLLQRVRGTMGKVYSPAVGNVMIDQSDQGYIAVSIEATPADIEEIVAAAREVAAELAAGRITQAELDTAREPLVAARLQAQESNAAWAGILSHAYRHPEAIDELLRYERDMRALTLDDVKRAAATWLREPAIGISRPAAMAKAASVGAKAN